jgi:hypothetical protein
MVLDWSLMKSFINKSFEFMSASLG